MHLTQIQELTWHDPRMRIWGFHCHQELPLAQFSDALLIQQKLAQFLTAHNIHIDNDDAIKPGYGPHLEHMWELRVERADEDVLEQMGMAVSFMAVNRFGLSGYIHPLMHDRTKDEDLQGEGLYNQPNALWFTYEVEQAQSFFFNPPRDGQGRIVDTRTPRIINAQERGKLLAGASSSLQFQDPQAVIINGYHIHVDFDAPDQELAMLVFDKFSAYLTAHNLVPTATRIYEPKENGPHVRGGWEAKFRRAGYGMLRDIGIAIGWLMCNRQGLSVFMHPETWLEGDIKEELAAHEKYAFFLGKAPILDLRFFSDQIAPE
jgi:aromatic ring-cleaving dioxygenase